MPALHAGVPGFLHGSTSSGRVSSWPVVYLVEMPFESLPRPWAQWTVSALHMLAALSEISLIMELS